MWGITQRSPLPPSNTKGRMMFSFSVQTTEAVLAALILAVHHFTNTLYVALYCIFVICVLAKEVKASWTLFLKWHCKEFCVLRETSIHAYVLLKLLYSFSPTKHFKSWVSWGWSSYPHIHTHTPLPISISLCLDSLQQHMNSRRLKCVVP